MNEGSKTEFGNEVSRMGSRLSDVEVGFGGGLRSCGGEKLPDPALGQGSGRTGRRGLFWATVERWGLFEAEGEFSAALGARAGQT